MANVNEGLGTPALGENVNSDAGFEAALAAKTGRTEELEGREPTVSTSIAEGLVEAGTAAARDERGRYTSLEEPEEEETPADDEAEDKVEEPEDDGLSPEVQALLAKHDGDAEAALAEALERHKNAERKIGTQGNELGQLREEIAELRGEVRAQREMTTTPEQQLESFSNEQLEEMVAEHGGLNAALWAVNNRPDLYERIHKIWRVDEPDDAGDFRVEYLLHKQRQELEGKFADAQPAAEVFEPQAAIDASLAEFAQEVGEDDWKAIGPHMTAALTETPKSIVAMLASEDPAERLDAVRAVGTQARILAGKGLTAAAKVKQQEAATERKRSATVASGSLRPAGKPEGGEEMTSEERQRKFKEQLLGTETTSVQEGLTFAKA